MAWADDWPVRGLDPRFKIGDVVRDLDGTRLEVIPPMPTLSGFGGRSTRGCRFLEVGKPKLPSGSDSRRLTLAQQQDQLSTEEEWQALLADKTRNQVGVTDGCENDEGELIPIF